MKRASLILLGSLLATTGALAATYVRVEKDGTKTYSDRPLPGGQQVDIQPAQTYSAPAPASPARTVEQREVMEAASFRYECALAPRNEETLQNPENVTLSVALTPGLRVGDTVRFAMDGTEVPGEQGSTSATIAFPDRGSHTANVRVTDRFGKTVCDMTSTFHVARTNLNSPTRRPVATPRPLPSPPRPMPR